MFPNQSLSIYELKKIQHKKKDSSLSKLMPKLQIIIGNKKFLNNLRSI